MIVALIIVAVLVFLVAWLVVHTRRMPKVPDHERTNLEDRAASHAYVKTTGFGGDGQAGGF